MHKKIWQWRILILGILTVSIGCASTASNSAAYKSLTLLDEQIDIPYDFIPRAKMNRVQELHYQQFIHSSIELANAYAIPGCDSCEKTLRKRRQKIIEIMGEANRLYSDVPPYIISDTEKAINTINKSISIIRNEKPALAKKKIVKFFVHKMPSQYTFAWPLEDFRISCPFGWRIHPITGKRQFHDGIDLAAKRGTIVFATAPGKIVFAGYKRRAGNVVVIEHPGGYRSFYAHLDEILIPPGITVSQGNPIGTVGTTGWTTGAHLHFKITKGNRVLDPMKVVGKEVRIRR